MSEAKAVLWDLDNTLFPSKHIASAVLEEILPDFGVKPPTAEEIHHSFGMHLFDFLRLHSKNHPDQQALWEAFNKKQQKFYEEVALFEGMIEVVAAMGALGIKQAIVTTRGNEGRSSASASAIIRNSGLNDYIGVVISGNDVKTHKPDPESLILALDRLKVKPENAAMVGDHAVDMQAAKNAEIIGIGVSHENITANIELLIAAGASSVCVNADEISTRIRHALGV